MSGRHECAFVPQTAELLGSVGVVEADIGNKAYRLAPTESNIANGTNTIITVLWKPDAIEWDQADHLLLEAEVNQGGASDDGLTLHNSIGYYGEIGILAEVTNFPEITKLLGYEWVTKSVTEAGTTYEVTEFTYPQPETINRILDELGVEGLRYKYYNGGHFTAVEQAEALIAGKWLIATYWQYQLHDHIGLHVLGALGLHGALLARFQEFAKCFYEQNEEEQSRRELPYTDPKIISFFRPSLQILADLTFKLDRATSVIARKVFTQTDGDLVQNLEWTLSTLYQPGGSLRSPLPNGIFVSPGYETTETEAKAMLDRYIEIAQRAKSAN